MSRHGSKQILTFGEVYVLDNLAAVVQSGVESGLDKKGEGVKSVFQEHKKSLPSRLS